MKISHLYKGTPAPLLRLPGLMSSIKRSAVCTLNIHTDFIEDDEVFNKTHHGGPNRVLHQYPDEHYQYWKQKYPQADFPQGSFGENLSIPGMDETNICIGDVYSIGKILCVVTEPRKPCVTINIQFNIQGFARVIQNESKTGWFYKILKPGSIHINDSVKLIDRPYPELTVDKCVRALLVRPHPLTLQQMTQNPILSLNWRQPAQDYLETGKLPDDKPRLGEI